MEQAVNTLKRYFKKTIEVDENNDCDRTSAPELGFKVSYDGAKSELKVKVIGARQLPTDYGNCTPRGYLVKVRITLKLYIINYKYLPQLFFVSFSEN